MNIMYVESNIILVITSTNMKVVAFSPHADMPKEFLQRWLELKKYLVTHTPKQKHAFELGFDMPHLERSEGGCGGNSNWFEKQIRPLKYDRKCCWHDTKMLYLNFCDSENKECKWEMRDIKRLSHSFCEVISHEIGSGGNCFHAFFIL